MNYNNNYNKTLVNNLLTAEEVRELQSNNTVNKLTVTKEESLASGCTHRYPDGNMAVNIREDNLATCSICGCTFRVMDINNQNEVIDIARNFKDLAESIKLFYIHIPASFRDYFSMLPLAEKLPLIAEKATESFREYERSMGLHNSYNNNDMAAAYRNFGIGSGLYNNHGAYTPNYQQMYNQGGYNPNMNYHPNTGYYNNSNNYNQNYNRPPYTFTGQPQPTNNQNPVNNVYNPNYSYNQPYSVGGQYQSNNQPYSVGVPQQQVNVPNEVPQYQISTDVSGQEHKVDTITGQPVK